MPENHPVVAFGYGYYLIPYYPIALQALYCLQLWAPTFQVIPIPNKNLTKLWQVFIWNRYNIQFERSIVCRFLIVKGWDYWLYNTNLRKPHLQPRVKPAALSHFSRYVVGDDFRDKAARPFSQPHFTHL